MQKNDTTPTRNAVTRFTLGQTFITPGAQEAIQIAGQTEIEFLRRGHKGSTLRHENSASFSVSNARLAEPRLASAIPRLPSSI
jgi:hypothetical protein